MASSPEINAFNVRLRASPEYAEWMRSNGINPGMPIRLTDQQRQAFGRFLQTKGLAIPRGAEIDPAGNLNENEGFGKQAKRWGPIVGGAALTAFGIPGVMPGLFTGGGAAAGGAAAARAGATAATGGIPASTYLAASAAPSVAGAGGSMGGAGLFSTLGRFFMSPGGQAVTNAGGNLAGALIQNRGANRAMDAQERSNREALEFLKEQDARDYAEYLKERERLWGQTDVDRERAEEDRQLKLLREREREGRLAPFRSGAERGYQKLSDLLLNPHTARY